MSSIETIGKHKAEKPDSRFNTGEIVRRFGEIIASSLAVIPDRHTPLEHAPPSSKPAIEFQMITTARQSKKHTMG